ncbi:MAG: ATP-binding domain-containing protein, partial [Rickettsiales bacterium]|nr:ATP-binding domain-containing protein [Rickettsiales bacterium]
NTPKRGVGSATLDTLREYARAHQISLFGAMRALLEQGALKPRMKTVLGKFAEQISQWRDRMTREPHAEMMDTILRESGYLAMWQQDKAPEAQGRVENLKELIGALADFENVETFLEHVSLVMDGDDRADEPMVSIMTMHGAKGLEFNTVFLAGWEDGIFPSQRSMDEKGQAGLEEERRLGYVGITRARFRCAITFTANRRVYNQWQNNLPSRFVDELPPEHVEVMNLLQGPVRAPVQPPASGLAEHQATPTRFTRAKATVAGSKPAATPASTGGFTLGQKVVHPTFGEGRIVKMEGSHLTIGFNGIGLKTILKDYVKGA